MSSPMIPGNVPVVHIPLSQKAVLTGNITAGQNVAVGVPAGYIMQVGSNGSLSWVPNSALGSSPNGYTLERSLGESMPETQRSFDAEAEIRALCKTVRKQAEEMQSLARVVEKLRSEMDELHAIIKDSRSRQLNGAGYWEES